MNSYSEMYETICRVCLSYENNKNMVSLIDNNSGTELSCYGKGIIFFANISIKPDDYLPKKMCQKCLFMLKQAIRFKFRCEAIDKRLQNLCKRNDMSREKYKESLVEYTMFVHHFPNEDPMSSPSDDVIRKSYFHGKNVEKNGEINESSSSSGMLDDVDDYAADNVEDQDSNEQDNESEADDILNKLESMLSNYENLPERNYKVKKRLSKRKFQTKHISQTHKLSKSDEKFVCSICKRVLANRLTYEHHMQRHTGCRYICEHCGKGFPVLAELQIHQVHVHGTGRYLQCKVCDFKAPRRYDLMEHERIHTGERPYACDKCGLTFRRRFIWKKHLLYHSEKKVQCTHCPRKFYQRGEMMAHVNNIHERRYVYLCNKCGVTYAKTSTMRRHLTERHGIPREMQGKVIRIYKGNAAFSEQKT